MANFPALKTGAVAQYPLDYGVRFSTQTVWFLDGSQQRFRLVGNGLRRWVVKLDRLDEQEISALISFAEQQGSATFAFTDPISGGAVANCIISGNQFAALMNGELNGQSTIEIEETA